MTPKAVEQVDRLAILLAILLFHGMGDVKSRSLRFEKYVRVKEFVRSSTYVLLRRFVGWCTIRLGISHRCIVDSIIITR
jgi:hypothetical protein